MKVLLDTNVLAELVKPDGHAGVHAALAGIPGTDLFLSVLTVGEIAKGIALLAPGAKRTRLTRWLAGIERSYRDRVLAIDVVTARLWGELTARAQQHGIIIPAADGWHGQPCPCRAATGSVRTTSRWSTAPDDRTR